MKAKVLIVEDNDQNRYLFSFLLQNAGYEVVQAIDGRAGIETATNIKPDLILLDIQLPDIDGYQVAKSMRANRGLHSTPIVAVTSYAMVGDREKTISAGCSGYIEKPIDPGTFVKEIEQYLLPKRDEG